MTNLRCKFLLLHPTMIQITKSLIRGQQAQLLKLWISISEHSFAISFFMYLFYKKKVPLVLSRLVAVAVSVALDSLSSCTHFQNLIMHSLPHKRKKKKSSTTKLIIKRFNNCIKGIKCNFTYESSDSKTSTS